MKFARAHWPLVLIAALLMLAVYDINRANKQSTSQWAECDRRCTPAPVDRVRPECLCSTSTVRPERP